MLQFEILATEGRARRARLTLNHGVYTTRTVTLANEVASSLAEWQPHVAILDMDLEGA